MLIMSVIISQINSETASLASKLADAIRAKFPNTTVHETIGAVVSPGDDYEIAIQKAVNASELLIVMVGGGWNVSDPNDYDFIAIQTALDNDTRIIPIFMDDAEIPAELPDTIGGLKRRVGSRVHQSEPDFAALLTAMEQWLKTGPPPLVPANKPTSEPKVAPPVRQSPPPPQTAWQGQPPLQPQQVPYGQPSPSGPYPPQEMVQCPKCRGRGKVGFRQCDVCTGTKMVTLQRRELYNKENSTKAIGCLVAIVVMVIVGVLLYNSTDLLDSAKSDEENLRADVVGSWQAPAACFEFDDDGTYELRTRNGETQLGTWSVIAGDSPLESDRLRMTTSGTTYNYQMTVGLTSMTLRDSQTSLILTKTSFCI
jgi:hypothetical protein